MQAQPEKEHQWLQRLVGEWTYEFEGSEGPDKPVVKYTGTERVRSLSGLWAVCEAEIEGPGGTSTTIMTIGYDPMKKAYVGSFVGAMMAQMWVYDGGVVDESGNVLTLETEGPSFTSEGKTAKYKDSIEFLSDDHRTLSSKVQDDDGNWQDFMISHYHRKK